MEQVSSTPQANFNESKPTNSAYKITFRKIARAAAAELRVHKKIAIISYVLFGVATLLFMFNAHYYSSHDSYGFTTVSFSPSGWGAFFGVLGIIVGYFAALNVFRDVNNQQLCDVTMALPIKATERFFSKLLALFYLQVGPLIIAALGGNGIALLFGRISAGPLDSEAWEILAWIVFGGLASSLFIMAVAVFCTCCSGAKAESAYFSLIMMFIINALPLTYVVSIIGECSGFQRSWLYDEGGIDVRYWGFLSLFENGSVGSFIIHNIISIVISLLVMFLSLFIYKKRDAKTVGTPIASRLFFEIFLVLGCFTIFSFFVFSEAAWWGVLIAGVIYIIINVIVSRAKINVMSFFTWIVKYAVTTAVFVAVMVVTVKTGGLGQIYSRPSAKYLEGATFNITCYDNDYYHSFGRDLYTDALTPEQAEQVMDICKKHMAKGHNEIPVADILTENGSRYYRSGTVYVEARSDTQFRDRPSSMRHFRQYTVGVKNSDYTYVVYELRYNQILRISQSELRALCDELQTLDFVHSVDDDDRIYVDEYYYY